jgi:hypothetical protein
MLTCSFCCVFAGKKLKKKLEDLEARAASAPPSPPQLHQELDAAAAHALGARTSPAAHAAYPTPFASPDPNARFVSPDVLQSNFLTEELSEEDRRIYHGLEPYADHLAGTSPQPSMYWSSSCSSSGSSTYADADHKPAQLPQHHHHHHHHHHQQHHQHQQHQHQAVYRQSPEVASYAAPPHTTSCMPLQAATYATAMPGVTAMTRPSLTSAAEPASAIYGGSDDLLQPYGLPDAFIAYSHLDADSSHQHMLAPQTPPLSDSFDLSLDPSPVNSAGLYPVTSVLYPTSPLRL